jgi:hypothetical protein
MTEGRFWGRQSNCSNTLWRVMHCFTMHTVNLRKPMIECTSFPSITRTGGFNWPKQRLNQFAVCDLGREKCTWHYWAFGDYEPAKAELAIAQRTLHNEGRIPLLAAYSDRRQGEWKQSLAKLRTRPPTENNLSGPTRFGLAKD